MGQGLHSCATTMHAVRKAIQRSQASVAEFAEQYGVNRKTERTWRSRASVEDAPMGPRTLSSASLSAAEAACVALRKHALLPLDDCLYALHASIPHLTCSSLHRLFQHNGFRGCRTPKAASQRRCSRPIPSAILCRYCRGAHRIRQAFHVRGHPRTSKAALVRLHERANTKTAVAFLNDLVEAMPCAIHTVLTGNGVQFADLPWSREKPTARWRGHPIDRTCSVHGIEHCLTKPNHPWTNGQVERINRTLEDATVRRYHDESHDSLRARLIGSVLRFRLLCEKYEPSQSTQIRILAWHMSMQRSYRKYSTLRSGSRNRTCIRTPSSMNSAGF